MLAPLDQIVPISTVHFYIINHKRGCKAHCKVLGNDNKLSKVWSNMTYFKDYSTMSELTELKLNLERDIVKS